MAAIVELNDVRKLYRVPRRGQGLAGALRTLFSRDADVIVALDALSFAIQPGEIVGYIGPNGAGKSTTVKLISGILRPDGGTIRVGGRDPFHQRREHVRDIGVVFGQRTQLWWDVPVRESFRLLAEIYGVPAKLREERLERFDACLGIGSLLKLAPRRLSLGQRMACDLAASLLHAPPLLFLDEPTMGLDVTRKEQIRRFIAEMNRELGTTVLLTTHDLSDMERLARRVLVLDRGRLVLDGSMETLRRQMGNLHQLHLIFAQPVPATKMQELEEKLRHRLEEFHPALGGLELDIVFDPERLPSPELLQGLQGELALCDFSLRPLPVEDLVRRFYAGREGAS